MQKIALVVYILFYSLLRWFFIVCRVMKATSDMLHSEICAESRRNSFLSWRVGQKLKTPFCILDLASNLVDPMSDCKSQIGKKNAIASNMFNMDRKTSEPQRSIDGSYLHLPKLVLIYHTSASHPGPVLWRDCSQQLLKPWLYSAEKAKHEFIEGI